jgi:phage-related tail protein
MVCSTQNEKNTNDRGKEASLPQGSETSVNVTSETRSYLNPSSQGQESQLKKLQSTLETNCSFFRRVILLKRSRSFVRDLKVRKSMFEDLFKKYVLILCPEHDGSFICKPM